MLNKKLRQDDSGSVTIQNNLISFLYSLMRDYLPTGTIEKIVQEIENKDLNQPADYSNGWLALYAENIANRLKNISPKPIPKIIAWERTTLGGDKIFDDLNHIYCLNCYQKFVAKNTCEKFISIIATGIDCKCCVCEEFIHKKENVNGLKNTLSESISGIIVWRENGFYYCQNCKDFIEMYHLPRGYKNFVNVILENEKLCARCSIIMKGDSCSNDYSNIVHIDEKDNIYCMVCKHYSSENIKFRKISNFVSRIECSKCKVWL